MSSTHDVYCKNCKKRIAWWSQFDNIQYEDEYQCSAAITHYHSGRKKHPDNLLIMNKLIPFNEKKGKEMKKLIRDVWKVEIMKGKTIIRSNWTYCEIVNHTTFCKECAKKLKYKCPVCGGTIVLARKS